MYIPEEQIYGKKEDDRTIEEETNMEDSFLSRIGKTVDIGLIIILTVFSLMLVIIHIAGQKNKSFYDALNQRAAMAIGPNVETNIHPSRFKIMTRKTYEVLQNNIDTDGSKVLTFKGSMWVEKTDAESDAFFEKLKTDLAAIGLYGTFKIYVTEGEIISNQRDPITIEMDIHNRKPYKEIVVKK